MIYDSLEDHLEIEIKKFLHQVVKNLSEFGKKLNCRYRVSAMRTDHQGERGTLWFRMWHEK